MRTLFSVSCCLLLAAPLVNAGPPNPTPSDAAGNTAGGTNALVNNTTGDFNTAFGFSALFSNTSGLFNTATGASALRTNTGGGANSASGYGALASNTTGLNNRALRQHHGLLQHRQWLPRPSGPHQRPWQHRAGLESGESAHRWQQ